MRVNRSLVSITGFVVCVPLLAQGKRNKSVEPPTTTESAAARATRLAMADDTGARRDSDLRAPALQQGLVVEAEAQERGTTGEPVKPPERTGPLSGAMEELIARQMQRSAIGLERCVAELRARDGQLRGDLELTVAVAQKRASATVSSTGTVRGDAAFDGCVTETMKGVRLSLPDLVFPWRIHIGR